MQQLLQNNNQAQQYFKRLPSYVQEQIRTRETNIHTYAALRDYAENLVRGDD